MSEATQLVLSGARASFQGSDCDGTVVLRHHVCQDSLEGLLNEFPGPDPISESAGLERGLEIYISSVFPCDAHAVGLSTPLRKKNAQKWISRVSLPRSEYRPHY